MANWGIKIVKEGKNIKSTEPRDYIFNSAYGTVKVLKEPPNKTYETITVNASGNATATIAHNLGFVPLCLIFTEFNPGSGRWYSGVGVADQTDITSGITIDNLSGGTYVDDTNLYIKYSNASGTNKNVKYYYYIFGDSAE